VAEKAYLQTFGCQMNEHDSQRMREVLIRNGYEMTQEAAEATVILLNTCSVRHNPENKVYSELGRLRKLKAANPALVIGVGGCVAQQEGEAILAREKAVDIVFGPDHFFHLPEMIAQAQAGARVLMTEWAGRPPDRIVNFIPEEYVESGHVEGCRAYVAITRGCDNFCSFCIVPKTRGREVSRDPGNILREVRRLVQNGAKEIWLLGQNVNRYQAGGCGFYELLDAVSEVEGLRRLRFTSPHPNGWNNALSDLMAARPAVCNHLHLPFQAGSDRVLERMNRQHTIGEYLDKVRYLRAAMPHIELTTDLIVGFPSETEEDFEGTLRVLEEVRFSQLFSFKYSPRPGTRAAKWPDDVPRAVKEDRLQRVIDLQTRIEAEDSQRLVGSVQELLLDGAHAKKRGYLNGRTEGYRPVTAYAPHLEIGDFVSVRITGHRGHWLEGEIVP